MTILATDDFVRADNVDLGANWDTNTAYAGTLQILSNTVRANTTSQDQCETYNNATWPDDQYAEVTYPTNTANGSFGSGFGVVVRCAQTTKNNYRAVGNWDGYEVGKSVSGTFTSLSGGQGTTFRTAGTKLKLSISGASPATWTLYKDGVSFATNTDTSTVTSGRAGLFYSSTDTGAGGITYWEGGSVDSGATYTLMGQACL